VDNMRETGQDLKSERLRQGLTLEGISERTRISVEVLQALEAGAYGRIGTPLLVRSFIRTYCTALGIDAEPLLKDHNAEILACNQQASAIKRYQKLSPSFQRYRRRRTTVLLFLGVVVAGGVAAGIWVANKGMHFRGAEILTKDINPQQELPSDLSERSTAPGSAETEEETALVPEHVASLPLHAVARDKPVVTDQGSTAASGQPGRETASVAAVHPMVQVEAAPPPQNAEQVVSDVDPPKEAVAPETPVFEDAPSDMNQPAGHKLFVEADQEVWVQVRIDGKNKHSALLQPGERREWQVNDKVNVVLGNAGGVRMKWDGRPLRQLGRSGQVVRFHLPDPGYLEAP